MVGGASRARGDIWDKEGKSVDQGAGEESGGRVGYGGRRGAFTG